MDATNFTAKHRILRGIVIIIDWKNPVVCKIIKDGVKKQLEQGNSSVETIKELTTEVFGLSKTTHANEQVVEILNQKIKHLTKQWKKCEYSSELSDEKINELLEDLRS